MPVKDSFWHIRLAGAASKRASKGYAISIRLANCNTRAAHLSVLPLGLVRMRGPVDGFTISAALAKSLELGRRRGILAFNTRTQMECVLRPSLYSIIGDSPMVSVR